MNYVDGYVLAVANDKKEAYRQVALRAAQVFKDHGALSVVECWGDDVPQGKVTSFPMAVKCQENESVVFSWVTWPDKATRDQGLEKAMHDPRMEMDTSKLPFDGKRLIYGGFEILLNE